ncbi:MULTISPECIES: DUF3379 family protein [unclassified Luteibacter]|uniref:DUF3379 family protein n=1 Tax=unclassified Luteibacter TaxID=2620188 RepID=UPI0008C35774|nr:MULTISPECIES: DUF3379 family protein [unclassified Luteibacter]MDR6937555.1 hypothetical protein [Luteibacter sp. 3190]SEO36154.1 Protein of unknown function [Luteibacter sp. UNC138MFCol5.1]
MNCLDFRRRIGAEPRSRDPELLAHRDACRDGCGAFWQRAQRFEDDIEAAMAVPVPDGLADRILLAQATSERRSQVVRRRGWLAMAASLIIAFMGAGMYWRHADLNSLPALAVAHMPGELDALDLTRPMTDAQVDAGFEGRGARLKGPAPAGVTYVHDCWVGPYRAVHLVTRMNDEPVVALYMPGTMTAGDSDFHRDGWDGREMALSGGTLVVLAQGASRRTMDAVARGWRDAIEGQQAPSVGRI